SHGKLELRHGIALLGRLLEPFCSFGIVGGDTLATGIHQAEVVLGHRITLLRRLIKPLCGFLIIARHPAALRIDDSEIVLGARLALFGGGLIPLDCFRHVDSTALTGRIILSQRDLSGNVSRLRTGLDRFDIGVGDVRLCRSGGSDWRLVGITFRRGGSWRDAPGSDNITRAVGAGRVQSVLGPLMALATSADTDDKQACRERERSGTKRVQPIHTYVRVMVRERGLEPPPLAGPDPKSGVSAIPPLAQPSEDA